MKELTVTLILGQTEKVWGSRINIEHGSLVVRASDILVKAWAPGTWYSIEMSDQPDE